MAARNIRKEAAIYLQLGSLVTIWVLILLASGAELKINWEAVKKLPEVVTLYSLLYLLFTLWAWRLPIFQGWLVPFPDLQGTWAGVLQSTWNGSNTPQPKLPVPIVIAIKQSFSSISCVMYSRESTSLSASAQLLRQEDELPLRLSFTYHNHPRANVRERSEMHYGAAILRVVTHPERMLEGQYWTDRKTTGDLQVLFRSKGVTDHFDDPDGPLAIGPEARH